ncbi:hypothetical protein RRG08_050440 [Elysia crispata]|uniref:Uncharacterized protein n=1 Tax=Elysia crispata TaxID=231223 RepID=A0AAE1DHY6_9GAST|nr:hypothetical protein RRG08_050440 [Elysia crispata]
MGKPPSRRNHNANTAQYAKKSVRLVSLFSKHLFILPVYLSALLRCLHLNRETPIPAPDKPFYVPLSQLDLATSAPRRPRNFAYLPLDRKRRL